MKYLYLLVCRICGHRALLRDLKSAKLERNRHYHYCHKNVKPYEPAYTDNVEIIRVREDTALPLVISAVAEMSRGLKPSIKLSL